MIAEEYLARAEREIAPKLSRTAACALLKVFATYLGSPDNFLFKPAVLHADLSGITYSSTMARCPASSILGT